MDTVRVREFDAEKRVTTEARSTRSSTEKEVLTTEATEFCGVSDGTPVFLFSVQLRGLRASVVDFIPRYNLLCQYIYQL